MWVYYAPLSIGALLLMYGSIVAASLAIDLIVRHWREVLSGAVGLVFTIVCIAWLVSQAPPH